MTRRFVGFLLICAALVGGFVVMGMTEDYHPAGGLVWNLGRASVPLATETRSCPRLTTDARGRLPTYPQGCRYPSLPLVGAAHRTVEPTTSTHTVVTSQLSLGTALGAIVAIALAGVGVIVFGDRKGAT